MVTNYTELYREVPKWIFALVAVLTISVMIYSFFFASCRVKVLGLSFGPDVTCPGSSQAVSALGIPHGAVIPFESEKCPIGWEVIPSLQGRYLVGSYLGEQIGFEVGERLSGLENRVVGKHLHGIAKSGQHGHASNKSEVHSHSRYVIPEGEIKPMPGITVGERTVPSIPVRAKGVSYVSGDIAFNAPDDNGGHAHGADSAEAHAHSVGNAGTIEGTNSPYLTMLFCKKAVQ